MEEELVGDDAAEEACHACDEDEGSLGDDGGVWEWHCAVGQKMIGLNRLLIGPGLDVSKRKPCIFDCESILYVGNITLTGYAFRDLQPKVDFQLIKPARKRIHIEQMRVSGTFLPVLGSGSCVVSYCLFRR